MTGIHVAFGGLGRIAVLRLDHLIVEHVHPHAHVLAKLSGPDGEFRVGQTNCPLRDDSMVLVDPWVPHSGQSSGRDTVVLALNFDAAPISRRGGVFRSPVVTPSAVLQAKIRRLSQHLLADDLSEIDLEDLIVSIKALYSRPDEVVIEESSLDYRIRRVLRGAPDAPLRDYRIEQLPATAGLSRSHFFELFRHGTGVSPRAYFNALRLESAIQQLTDTDLPLAELSHGLGFSSPAHFTRFFRHHVGSTPSEYRRGAMSL
jgi:AraC-like DNA-binding protein